MALDLPLNPTLDQTYAAANGITYQFDGEKWVVFVDPASGTNVWTRDNATTTIYPILDGDDVAVRNSGGTETVKLFGETGTVQADVFAVHLLDDLP